MTCTPRPRRPIVRLASSSLVALLAACAPAAAPSLVPAPSGVGEDARRIHHAVTGTDGGLDAMVADLSRAQVVFLGERHDDPATHRLQLAILRALGDRAGRELVLSLEMFERDVQAPLDSYLAGDLTEAAFLAGARPWPNYATDYRPLVELARQSGWPVIAANVPRPMASAVARGGLAALDTMPAERRSHAAAEVRCPDDAYRAKFFAQMEGAAGHGAPSAGGTASDPVQRYYEAQCVKDETMAESIARVLDARRLVVHVNGSFHSDEGLGTPERLLRRRPGTSMRVVSFLPVSSDSLPDGRPGDWIVLTSAPPAP